MKRFRGYGGIRKLCSVLALLLLLQMPVSAADVSPSVEYNGNDPIVNGATISSKFTGHIPAAMLDIELPIGISFEVNPNFPLDESTGYNQVVDDTGSYQLSNNGGAVKLSLVEMGTLTTTVELDGATPEMIPFQYLGTMADAAALAAIPTTGNNRQAGAMVSLWITEPNGIADLEDQAITPEKLEGSKTITIGTMTQNSKSTLQVYCYAKTNFIGRGFEFTITPVLKAELT